MEEILNRWRPPMSDRHLRPDDREEQDEIFRMTSKVEKQRGAEESDPPGPDDDWLDGPAMAQLGAWSSNRSGKS